jgi:tripartite-type tricarboxylate transporter receptor subunit TctC
MTISRRALVAAVALAGVAPLTAPPRAQTTGDPASYPGQQVRLVVPFSAGSMTDILARALADKLQTKWGQQVIVENRPGIAGTASVAKASNDGYTLMLTSNGHTVISAVNKNVTFDPLKDFAAISAVATMPSILIAPPDAPTKTVKELIDAAKANPGKLNYSSAGLGSATGIAAELFRQTTKTDMVLVAHKGLPESQTSVIRNDTQLAFTFFNVGGDLIQSGKLKALAVTGEKRMPQLPDVPTFKEAGLTDFAYDAWFGVMAPAGTPAPIIAKIARDVDEAVKAADMKARFEPQGVELISSEPGKFSGVITSDSDRFGKLFQK